MKKLKLLFFVFILFLVPNVFADTSYNMTGLITSPVNFPECGVGSYTGVELNGATNCWNTNTRYQGTLNRIYFNLPAPNGSIFESDTAYRLSLKMATDDWRNNFGTVVVSPGSNYTNNFVDTFSFVSMKQINITFTVPYSGSTTYQYLWVNLPAKSSSHLITGVSNWKLSNVTLTKLTSGSSGGSTTPSGPSTTFDDTSIINSGKENTQDIINNNNNNTQDIINNNNNNTQDIINNQKELLGICYKNLIDLSNFNTSDLSTSGYRYFISLTPGKTYTIKSYDDVFNFKIGQSRYSYTDVERNDSLMSYTFTYTPNPNNNEHYLMVYYPNAPGANLDNHKLILVEGNYNGSFINYNDEICSSKLDETNASINNSTNTIINNQNDNTNKQIDSQKVCSLYTKSNIIGNGYINASGIVASNSNFGYTDYIIIDKYSTIDLVKKSYDTDRFCFYNSSKSMISCSSNSSSSLGSITIPENAFYFRFSINKNTDSPNFSICKSGNQSMNDTLTDSSIESGTGQGFFDNFTSEDFGLSQIITIPLNTIQSLTSKSCSPLQVPIPFTNSNVSLPCMTQIYETKFSSIYNLWKIVSFGIVAYLIAIDIFHIVKGFKDPESDKVEVLDL